MLLSVFLRLVTTSFSTKKNQSGPDYRPRGLVRTKGVGQRVLAAAINSPISVMETAGEGGAWGIALLGSYLVNNEKKQSLADFLDEHVFAGDAGIEVSPTAEDVEGFNKYIENYKAGLPIEEAAVRFKR